MVVALVSGRSAWVAHAGDSRALSCAPRGQQHQHVNGGAPAWRSTRAPAGSAAAAAPPLVGTVLTRDHNPSDPAERTRVEAGAYTRSR